MLNGGSSSFGIIAWRQKGRQDWSDVAVTDRLAGGLDGLSTGMKVGQNF